MLKIQAENSESGPIINVRLRQSKSEVFVEVDTETSEWTVFGLRENNGKLVAVVYEDIEDDVIATDDEGKIQTISSDGQEYR